MVDIIGNQSCLLTPISISKLSSRDDKSQMSARTDLDQKLDTSQLIDKNVFSHEHTESVWRYSLLLQESTLSYYNYL